MHPFRLSESGRSPADSRLGSPHRHLVPKSHKSMREVAAVDPDSRDVAAVVQSVDIRLDRVLKGYVRQRRENALSPDEVRRVGSSVFVISSDDEYVPGIIDAVDRSEEHTSELQSL